MTVAIVAGSALLGLIIGSFLNVVIYRIPAGLSIVKPASRCPSCESPINARDNIPVLGWLLLRGRCRNCGARISKRYPLVEALTGVLFALTAWRHADDAGLPAMLILVGGLVALSAIDLDTFTLPRKVIWTTYALCAVALLVGGLLTDDVRGIAEAAGASAAAFALLFVIHVISPRGMGFGDVRLAALIGLVLGWLEFGVVFVGLFFGFLLAAVVGIALMALKRRGRKDRIPFGPFLAGGAVLALWAGVAVIDLYLGR